MKATLIKEKEGVYSLLDGNRFISTTECKDDTPNKLSLKNCEAVANGYDLDELAKDYANGKSSSDVFKDAHKRDFKEGFQKALSILGDKKFSEGDMKKAMNKIVSSTYSNKGDDIFDLFLEINRKKYIDEYMQSLQQTEWDVVIVTKPYTEVNEGFNLESKREPKLDADGCLILKRI